MQDRGESMKKYVGLVLLVGVLVFLVMVCNITEEAPSIELPDVAEISVINITTPDEEEISYSAVVWIEAFIGALSRSEATNRLSVQDFPNVDSYGKIDIVCEDSTVTCFYYQEGDMYYIEQPYQGIYETSTNLDMLIIGVE